MAEWLGHIIEENLGPGHGPEDYCYYGVEGNPVFTGRLQALERRVMDLRPRPLRHAHFLTGSVGAGEDGPAKLWLDTVNAKENYWGSSVFKGHQDVRKSAAETNSTETYADVEGYTVGRLMRMTLEDLQEGSQREGGGAPPPQGRHRGGGVPTHGAGRRGGGAVRLRGQGEPGRPVRGVPQPEGDWTQPPSCPRKRRRWRSSRRAG